MNNSDFMMNSRGVGRRISTLLTPFVFFAAGVFLLSLFFYNSYIANSPYWTAIVTDNTVEENDVTFIGSTLVDRDYTVYDGKDTEYILPPTVIKPTLETQYSYLPELPPLLENGYVSSYEVGGYTLGQMWAKLSVHDDLLVEDLPVYQGDNRSILNKGVGHLYGSTFPGEGGVCVLSAHVSGRLGYFNNLSDPDIYKKGTQLKLETSYGIYIYEVVDTKILNYKDTTLVKRYGRNDDGSLRNNYRALCDSYDADELLLLYTCHPEGTAFRTERFYLICRRIYGYSWR